MAAAAAASSPRPCCRRASPTSRRRPSTSSSWAARTLTTARRNHAPKPGEAATLPKPVGGGLFPAGIKKSPLSPAAYQEMIETTTTLNRIGAELGKDAAAHAVTDVTGFGVLGHALEL